MTRANHPRRSGLVLGVSLLFALTGCVSAGDPTAGPATPPTDTRPAAADCDLLTTGFLETELGMTFREGRLVSGNSVDGTECQWSGDSRIAVVKTVRDDAPGGYAKAKGQIEATLGPVEAVAVPGAGKAFLAAGYGLIGMRVGGEYVQVLVTVPTADAESVRAVAAEAATNAGNGS